MKIKIATLGSCITRDNFNSKINPYYKTFFEVIASQNQTAIPSLMSEKSHLSISKELTSKSTYIQNLLHKEYSKEFLETLKKEKPDYLIMDMDPDIKFGLVKISEDNYITNNHNFRGIPQIKDKEINNINENYEEYFNIWKKAINNFFEFMENEVPNCKIILIKGRFEETFSDGTSLNEIRKQNKLPIQSHIEMNKNWDTLDKYIIGNYDVEAIDMVDSVYKLNKDHIWGPYYLHYEDKYYNSILNKLIKLTYTDKNESLYNLKSSIQRIYLNDDYELLHTKAVEVELNSDENIMQIARKNKDVYKLYKDLLRNDYILYYHNNGKSRLYKRRHMKDLWRRKDLHQQGEIFYTLDYPNGIMINEETNKKLLVIFNCMPGSKNYDGYNVSNRLFPKFFSDIEKSLVKNVHILRPMDLNLSHGSHYINTVNNKNMEQDIVDVINNVKGKLGIDDKDIVLYGVSKGGTGALYYSSLLDLKSLAVDPIISLGEYNKNDAHFLRGFRKEDLTEDINNNLARKSKEEKYIIGSENVEFNYSKMKGIKGDNVKKVNKNDDQIISHPDVSKNTVPEQLMILNKMLLDNDLLNEII
ncbi:accessory Sec system protein Asp2 [Staphylococcus equorum]|uniref:accessory Sec system protein Asp2 n=1 Tax=Staphylococcus equorum TaxID=246432 RepID=UPI002DBC7F27|nr:accessory Sec system protein Asp2 [Staphylococcus equorum]MEB7795437.1 XcbB/CpsF family capsular polysaccharide biosynthesis protein [Staphylococcus equorum]